MTLDEAREFYDFLRGRGPKGFRLPRRPRLGKRAAFSVLYVLQEKFRLIPDTIEQCDACHEHWCISCEPHYSSQGEPDGLGSTKEGNTP